MALVCSLYSRALRILYMSCVGWQTHLWTIKGSSLKGVAAMSGSPRWTP